MSRNRVIAGVLWLLALSWSGAWAQENWGEAGLQAGLQSFKLEQYREALRSFQAVIAGGGPRAPEAYFWAAKALLALEQIPEAGELLTHFLANYPDHPYAVEAEYQASRLPFLKKDYESAVQASQQFIRRYPKSEFVPNAWFWTAESLYLLGRLEEASRLYAKVVQDFPQSFKVETARYRLSLLEFKRREDELLRLLKWSHEESLRSVAEFQRKEQAYEQAIGAYQRRLSALGGDTRGIDPQGADSGRAAAGAGEARPAKGPEAAPPAPEESEALKRLEAENASLRARLQSLESRTDADAALRRKELEDLERTLRVKAEALALKEALLLRLEQASRED